MKPERTVNGGVKNLGWAKHKRNSDAGKKYYRYVRRKVKKELKESLAP